VPSRRPSQSVSASSQKLIEMDDGSALILTMANYFTPAGKEIPVDGVTPTREVRPLPDDVSALNDKTLPVPTSSPTDPVVKKAIEILQAPAVRKAA